MKSDWLGLWACAAILLFSGVSNADAGAPPCASSDVCAAPTAHCHPTLRECVECLSSRNCAADQACDVATGRCVKCNGDVDCPQERPYCTASGCVECRTNTNCAQSLECVSGTCGKCGDGTCSKRERLMSDFFGQPGAAPPFEMCLEDCQDQCPSGTAKLDEVVRIEVKGTRSLFESGCSNQSVPDAVTQFTAKARGSYFVNVSRVTGEGSFTFASITGACPGEYTNGCGFSEGEAQLLQFDAEEDQTVMLVVDTLDPGSFEITVSATAPPCQGPLCVPGGGGDAGANDQGKTVCLESARERGEEMCGGVTCACSHCPRDYDDCAIIPGCRQVSDCLRTSDCVGQDCIDTGACRSVVNSYGGPSAPAFRAANALQSCSLAFTCNLPCGDAGTGSPPDAGASLCSPREARTCSCGEAGAGEQTCNDDGSAYSDCKCEPRPPKDDNSSCECGFSTAENSSTGVTAMIALVSALIGRRRRHRARPAR